MKTNSICRATFPTSKPRFAARLVMLLAGVLIAGAGCNPQPPGPAANEIAGTYGLISVDGKPVPCAIETGGHRGVKVTAGSFRIGEDGTCLSRITFTPGGGGREFTREVHATFTRSGSSLKMKWKGAGVTTGTVEGTTFEMVNEGTRFTYRK